MSEIERRRRLEQLFVDHSAAVRAYAARRIIEGEADDVASEVFVVAWRRLDHVPEDALPWLLACAKRVVANRWRSSRRQAALRERLSWERPHLLPAGDGDSALGEASLRSARLIARC